MKLTVTINNTNYIVKLENPYSLAITLNFNQEQPQFFGAKKAASDVYHEGSFIGSTAKGGSCNVDVLHLTPQCNGTHTETIQHITNNGVAIAAIKNDLLVPATLITVTPITTTSERYKSGIGTKDKLITKRMLQDKLAAIDDKFLQALIIRTLPNEIEKQYYHYDEKLMPAFFSNDALEYLVARNVKHLVFDLPSLDKMYDNGMLSNHHIFWNVKSQSRLINANSRSDCTVTELAFIANEIEDGLYLLNLQFPAFSTDAAPSRPLLYKLGTT